MCLPIPLRPICLKRRTPALQMSLTIGDYVLQLQWSEFDREFLHAYRRTYRLDTPTAFSNEYHKLVLSRPGGIGLHSPTMARRKDFRRQSKEELSNAVRTHFAGMGVIESNALTDLFHKVKNRGVSKTRRPERVPRDMDR